MGVKSAAPPSLSSAPSPLGPPLWVPLRRPRPCSRVTAPVRRRPLPCAAGRMGGGGRELGGPLPAQPRGCLGDVESPPPSPVSVSAPQYQLGRPDGRRAWHQVTVGDKATAPPTLYFPFFCLSFFFSTLQSPHSSLKRTKAPPGRGYYFTPPPRPPAPGELLSLPVPGCSPGFGLCALPLALRGCSHTPPWGAVGEASAPHLGLGGPT